jgi:hypothetical protein
VPSPVPVRDDAATCADITDGADDKQIDAVIVDDPEERVVVSQRRFIMTGQVDGAPLKEVLGTWVRLQDRGALQKDCEERLKRKVEAIGLALDEDYRVVFELITTGNSELFPWGGCTNRGRPEAIINQAPVADTTVSGQLFTS